MRSDSGFTLIEVLVASLTTIVVFAMTLGLIVAVQAQQQDANATVVGARQEQLSTMEVLQYVRSAYSLVAVSGPAAGSTSSSFEVDSYIGTNQGSLTPNAGQITVAYAAGASGALGTLKVTLTGWMGTTPSTTNVTNYFITRDVLAPGSTTPMFTYYAYQTGATGGTIEAISDPAKCLADIVAIGINMTFSAPGVSLDMRGGVPGSASSLNTIVYMHDVTSSPSAPAGGVC